MTKFILLLASLVSFVAFADVCPMGNEQIRGTLERLYQTADSVTSLDQLPGRADLRSFWMSMPESSYQDGNCGTDGFYKVALKGQTPEGVFLSFNQNNVFIPLKENGLSYPTNPYGHGIYCKSYKDDFENIIICSFYAGQGRMAYSCFSDSAVSKSRCIFEDNYP